MSQKSKVRQHLRFFRWSKIDGFWLPELAEQSTNFNGQDKLVSQIVKLQWAIGGKAPDAAFDLATEDFCQRIMDHFKADFMRIQDGVLTMSPPYEPPSEIFEHYREAKGE
ncbi:hypothetical protein [Stieleria varia]|uniref:Uncharacterized protein n=1 Tax=Stieleria varia TaxID=2528005 RepID=A0A5C6AL99_9BACT|nr:hypothetical protein [Stieleria varia]TWU00793.1 hypothetical protein Pla52n_41620 [Stieleria varia]